MEKIINKNIKEICANFTASNIYVYSEEVESVLIKCADSFLLSESDDILYLEENLPKNSYGNVIINNSLNSSVIIKNNRVINCFKGSNIINSNNLNKQNNVEIVLPMAKSNLTFRLETMNGSIIVKDLSTFKFRAKTMNGAISFYNIDILNSEIKTMNGDIVLFINDHTDNYDVDTQTMSGSVSIQDMFSNKGINETINIKEKRYIKAKTMNGNISIVFERKR